MFRRSLTRSSKRCRVAMRRETSTLARWTSSEKNLREFRWRKNISNHFLNRTCHNCFGPPRVLRVNTRLLKRRPSWSWTKPTKRSTSCERRWRGTPEKVGGWVTSGDAQLVYDLRSAKMVIDDHGWSLVIIWWINQRPFPWPHNQIPTWLFFSIIYCRHNVIMFSFHWMSLVP